MSHSSGHSGLCSTASPLHRLLEACHRLLGSWLLARHRKHHILPAPATLHTIRKLERNFHRPPPATTNPPPLCPDPYHLKTLLDFGNRPGRRILEIGSREVTGPSHMRQAFGHAHYTGFDYYPGANVDVVGDAHKLSRYFAEPFDLIYSYAVFEHLAMPWVAAHETAKCLKIGGLVAVTTHFAYSLHERPWHFFHFTEMGLRALFPPALGFEWVEAGFTNPLEARFLHDTPSPELRGRPVPDLYCHVSLVARKIRETPATIDWATLPLDQVVGSTHYPAPPTPHTPPPPHNP